jgi:glycosyltransferase involved in cell wall biosynthesis
MSKAILITSPSLDTTKNVSGISSLVSTIIAASNSRLIHFKLGSKDNEKKSFLWLLKQPLIYINALYVALFKKFGILHLNLGLEKMSIVRDFIVAFLMKNIFRKKFVLHIHGGYYLMNKPKEKWVDRLLTFLFKHADSIIVLSEMEKEILTERYGNYTFHVLPNAVDFSAGAAFKRIASDKIRFVFLGRINSSKGIYIISEAFQYLRDYYDNFSFSIYGAGPELEGWLSKLDAYNGLNYKYEGVVGGEEKWQALYNADVFLLPSTHGEGMPIAMIEAMAAGTVPIVTNDASITAVVQNEENGFVISKNNPQELANAMQKIIDGKIAMAEVSQKATETIRVYFDISSYVKKLDSIYSSLN